HSATRLWQPKTSSFKDLPFPALVSGVAAMETGVRFAIVQTNGFASVLTRQGVAGLWHFTKDGWSNDASLLAGLDVAGQPVVAVDGQGKDRGVRFRDIDHDGRCELLVGNESQRAALEWSAKDRRWKSMLSAWPKDAAFVTADGRDNGLRFVDVNNDGFDDLLLSNEDGYSLWLYIATPRANLGWEKGFTFRVRHGTRAGSETGAPYEISAIVRAGSHRDNGVWFKNGVMWVQNEDTAALPDVVDRRSFKQLITGNEPSPKSPEESLAAFEVIPGFKVELVASEPLVMDPVAFDWGADGRLWVVEMADYPLGMDGKGKSGGRIVFLTDTDGDGRYDKRTVFMDGVHFPNGIMPWRKGILVSAAPEIFYAEDTDGDGKADVKKILFTGFREGNQQHRVNGFEFGLDGWVYAANGDSGGLIVPVGGMLQSPANTNAAPIDIRGYDIRFKPDTGEIDLIAGQTQFGRHRDDWGNWFGNNNPTWLWHYQLPVEYLKRNPYLAVKSTRTVTIADDPPNRVFAIARLQQRFNWSDRVYEVTSANSAAPYRDVLFGPAFASSVFASEPANNVVHREVLEPDGVTFKSRRAPGEQDREFLASKDNWFRPTMLKTGPDGALYIADMYRLILEHPEYFPEELRSRPDLRDGDDKGRIWRVRPATATLRRVPNLTGLKPRELAAAVNSPNGWQRDTAQRLLMELPRSSREEKDALLPAVVELKRLMTADDAKVRLQALFTLQALGVTDEAKPGAELVGIALSDKHPSIRAQAVRMASGPDVLNAIKDDSVLVRYQAAFRLGDLTDPGAGPALARLAMRDFGDSNMRIAILSSANGHYEGMLKTVLESMRNPGFRSPISPMLLRELAGLAVARNDVPSIKSLLGFLSGSISGEATQLRLAGLGGVVEALGRRNQSLSAFVKRDDVQMEAVLQGLEPVFADARRLAQDAKSQVDDRRSAMLLMGRSSKGALADAKLLASLLNSIEPAEIQRAALDSLKEINLPEVSGTLLEGWRSYPPSTRTEVLGVLLRRTDWTQTLLDGVESGGVAPTELGAVARQKLLSHAQVPIRLRAEKLFGAVNTDRQAVIKKYSGVPGLKGDSARGAVLFRTHCTTCHSFKGEGNAVGPDLGSMADKSVASLLVAILDPNQAVDAAYTPYTLETKDGRELTGIIVSETPASISLRLPGGTESAVVRSEIRKLSGGRLSLMPEGLESVLPPEAMADLVAYLLR
ncbi:MAG TPA: PVC-type heme-binding CxxCH protein, partial [Roseimicrobium sp.]|nr:PVC-type heme-binding CxxCH protein [Roseimicrobium sp.]